MIFKSKEIRTVLFVALAMLSISVNGQDLLAKQAPIDKKMRAIDSVSLHRLIGDELLGNPASELYPTWSKQTVHNYNVQLPVEHVIDLKRFCMPTTSRKITSKYGYRRSFRRFHYGIDVKVYVGDTIYAAFDGKVRLVKYERSGYGKYVVIRHPNGLETVYAHMSKQLVAEDQIVRVGTPIGLGGNTGRSYGSHLHFETRFLGRAINPAEMFDFEAQDIVSDTYTFRSGNGKTVASGSSQKNGSGVHRVKSGESLSSIAAKRGTTIDRLCKLNGITRKTVLRPGQILRYS